MAEPPGRGANGDEVEVTGCSPISPMSGTNPFCTHAAPVPRLHRRYPCKAPPYQWTRISHLSPVPDIPRSASCVAIGPRVVHYQASFSFCFSLNHCFGLCVSGNQEQRCTLYRSQTAPPSSFCTSSREKDTGVSSENPSFAIKRVCVFTDPSAAGATTRLTSSQYPF